ncbi:MAG: pyridoxal kinase [Pseudomonadota bacterium]
MATVLVVSSQTVRGAVGAGVAGFALQRLGHRVWQIPTVLFSNHPGLGPVAGEAVSGEKIARLWRGILENGWASDVDAVLTGYVARSDAVHAIARIVDDCRAARSDVQYICDPAVGDEPKGLYVDAETAGALRDTLLPRADCTTPNRFELSYLTGAPYAETVDAAVEQARMLSPQEVIATSIPTRGGAALGNVRVSQDTHDAISTTRRPRVPHGTGDLFAGLYLGEGLRARDAGTADDKAGAFAPAVARLERIIAASEAVDELALTEPSCWEAT